MCKLAESREKQSAKIAQCIKQDDLAKTLCQLISYQTVNPPGNERDCCEYIADLLRDAGAHVDLVGIDKNRPNVLATIGTEGEGRTLLLNGHVDVVAPGQGWTLNPFGGELIDGKVFGRGASDMKSGIVASLAAMKALLESDVELSGRLCFAAVVDEESFGPGGTRFLLRKGLQADMAIVAEPTDLRIEVAQRGVMWLQVRTSGRAAHAGRPWLGLNAIYQMLDFLTELRKHETTLAERKHEYLSSPSMSVGRIEGGSRANIVPDSCTAVIDRRLIPGETDESVLAQIGDIIARLKTEHPAFDGKLELIASADPFEISVEHELVRTLESAFHSVMGVSPSIGGKDATTDAGVLVKAGIPTVIFGPGQYKMAHAPDECVEMRKVTDGARILAEMANAVLGKSI